MWIELHDSAREHPKILKIARDLGIPKVQALGHMCSLWLWTLRMSPDGNLSSFDKDDIEIGAEWNGDSGEFVSAAIQRRLIDTVDGELVVHDWEVFSGSLKSASRARDYRARKRALQSRDVTLQCGDITQNDRPTDQTDQTDQTSNSNSSRDVQKVWDHWLKAKPNTRRRKLTAKHPEHRLIKKRLVDYQPEDLCKAIDGMFADTWSVEHDKLELGWALRQDDKHNNVDRFIETRAKPKPDPDQWYDERGNPINKRESDRIVN